jgi:radical SAM protein with 4Fe4S-binding SPASM domain
VFSNLTFVTDKLTEDFRRYGVRVATSFYSPHEETHDSITQSNDSFRKTVGEIKKIMTANLPLRVSVIATEKNRGDIEGAVRFLKEMGVEDVKVGPVLPVGRGQALTLDQSLEEGLKGCGACWMGSLVVSWDGSVHPCLLGRTVHLGNVQSNSLEEILSSDRTKTFRKLIHTDWLTRASNQGNTECPPDKSGCPPWDEPTCPPNCSVRFAAEEMVEY